VAAVSLASTDFKSRSPGQWPAAGCGRRRGPGGCSIGGHGHGARLRPLPVSRRSEPLHGHPGPTRMPGGPLSLEKNICSSPAAVHLRGPARPVSVFFCRFTAWHCQFGTAWHCQSRSAGRP
jgi:hypothetical protein